MLDQGVPIPRRCSWRPWFVCELDASAKPASLCSTQKSRRSALHREDPAKDQVEAVESIRPWAPRGNAALSLVQSSHNALPTGVLNAVVPVQTLLPEGPLSNVFVSVRLIGDRA